MFCRRSRFIIKILTGVIAILSFFLIEEAGRIAYTKFYTPTSGGRELYYAIWLFSMYLAPAGIILSCILNLRLKWIVLFFACFLFSVFYVFRDNLLWAILLLTSYLAALLVAFVLRGAINKMSLFYNRRR